jgi:hypothetical protein
MLIAEKANLTDGMNELCGVLLILQEERGNLTNTANCRLGFGVRIPLKAWILFCSVLCRPVAVLAFP